MASDQLTLTRNGKEFTLRQMGENTFVGDAADGEQIAIGFPGPESGEALYVVVDDGPCQRVATPPVIPPNLSLWQAFVGTYRLPKAALVNDDMFVVSFSNGIISLTWKGTTVPCIPLEDDQFACDFGLIRFTAATEGPLLEIWQTMTARRIAT
jgi:hypothetical protein